MTPPGSPTRFPWPLLLAAGLLVFGLLPVANWLEGGHAMPQHQVLVGEWTSGSLLALGIGVILAILGRRLPLWKDGLLAAPVGMAWRHPHRAGFVLAVSAGTLYALVAARVFDGRPLLIDEIAQLFQARIFAQGRTWLPTGDPVQLTSFMHILDFDGRVYSQFPPGWPALLALGVLAGAAWLTGPVCAALAALAWWHTVRRIEARPAVAVAAALLLAFAPFTVFMSGSHMNHVGAMLCVAVTLLGLAQATSDTRASSWAHVMVGGGIGALATMRPVDAIAFGLPIIVWYAVGLLRGRWRAGFVAAAAGLVPVAGLLWYNARTTGHPLLLGYSLLWGSTHGLGFHEAPWGFAHTPARGLELLNLYLVRLQSYLFETPVPSLLPATLALALTRRFTTFDRLLLASGGGVLVAYFAYWHDGFYLGPRFVYLLVPACALWTARALPALRDRWSQPVVYRTAVYTTVAALAIGVWAGVPMRARQYARGMLSMRPSYAAVARTQGVRDAVIIVRESWGAQLIARLWALGVPRSATEGLYRGIDTCILDAAIADAEQRGLRGEAALQRLAPLMADAARLVDSPWSPDETERALPGHPYSAHCTRRITEDRAGFTHLAPAFVEDQGSNVFVRDLHEQNAPLLRRGGASTFYLLKPASPELGAPLQLLPLSVDSLRQAWGASP